MFSVPKAKCLYIKGFFENILLAIFLVSIKLVFKDLTMIYSELAASAYSTGSKAGTLMHVSSTKL